MADGWQGLTCSHAEPGELNDEGLQEAYGVTAAQMVRLSMAAELAHQMEYAVTCHHFADLYRQQEARAIALGLELERRGAEFK